MLCRLVAMISKHTTLVNPLILSLTVICTYVCMYVCTVLLYFYILVYSASNGCKCVSINSVQFSSVQQKNIVIKASDIHDQVILMAEQTATFGTAKKVNTGDPMFKVKQTNHLLLLLLQLLYYMLILFIITLIL